MTEIETNDAHRELGYLRKSEIKELGEVQKVLKKLAETQPSQEEMRKKNFAFLMELDPTLKDTGQNLISLKIVGRQIDFYIHSNTWYSHAKRLFGYNIEKQVRTIQEFMKGKTQC